MPDFRFYNGLKSIPLSELPAEAWHWLQGNGDAANGKLTPGQAYRLVPWLYRAVDIRAKALQAMPFGLYKIGGQDDLSDQDEQQPVVRQVRDLLYLSEASLCIDGVVYWIVETNRFNMNPTPRWLLPGSIQADRTNGTLVFKRFVGAGEPRTYKADGSDGLLHTWLPNPLSEINPGVAPARVVLESVGVLRSLDQYLGAYFERGAIRATLLQIEGKPQEGEKKKLEAWWKRMIGGVKNAYETVAISAAVKPVVIGDSLKETVNKPLTDQERENIEVGLGTPGSLLRAQAANYATAQQDLFNLYSLTVVPEARLLEPMINAWLLQRGLRLAFDPERLEPYQVMRRERAKALQALAGNAPILTVDEARAELGYKPLPKSEQPAAATESTEGTTNTTAQKAAEPRPILGYHIEQGVVTRNEARAELGLSQIDESQSELLRQLQSQLAVLASAVGVGIPLDIAAPMVGLEVDLPKPEPAPATEMPRRNTPEDDDAPAPDTESLRSTDLDKWQRKAIRRLNSGRSAACDFESPHIAVEDRFAIRAALSQAATASDTAHLFASYKAAGALTATEQQLADLLQPIFDRFGSDALESILNGDGTIDYAAMSDELRAALLEPLAAHVTTQAEALAAEIGFDFDPAQLGTEASRWAESYSFDLVKGITERTRTVMQQSISAYQSTPGMTQQALKDLLSSAFGPKRSDSLAITEITRSAAEATNIYKRQLADAGIAMERVWRTIKGEGECLICSGFDGKGESEWSARYPDGAPAHPRCRCSITLRRVEEGANG